MRLNAFFFLLISFFGTLRLSAQDAQFSQYYAAPLYLNPALAGIHQKGSFGMNYRTQWPSITANYQTFSAYVDYHFEEQNSSLGFLFMNDKEGIAGLQSNMFALQYAYQLELNYTWTIRPAIQGAYYLRDINFSKLTFGDQFDNTGKVKSVSGEVLNTGAVANFFDLSLGGILFSPFMWLGISTHHLTEPNQTLVGEESPLSRRFSIHTGYKILLNERTSREMALTPTLNYRQQGKFDQLDVGAYLTLNPLLVGLWYRGIPIKTFQGIPNNESVILMVGLQTQKISFGYSFDYTISGLGIGTGGAHEISLKYNFSFDDPRKPSRRVRELRCPVPFVF